MKFLVDESVEFRIVLFLRSLGFNVISISEESPSISDPEVLKLAYRQKRVLITNDNHIVNRVPIWDRYRYDETGKF